VDLLYNRNNFTLISKDFCIGQTFLCLNSLLALSSSLRSQSLLSCQRCYNYYLLQDVQKNKITDCFAEQSCVCAEKSDVSQQRHSAADDSHKPILLLSVLCENILYQDRFCLRESFFLRKVLSHRLLRRLSLIR